MTWLAYRVTFRLLAPLHIGWRKLGNLQQTRSYVTGQALWGALTARLVREQAQSNYEEVSRLVNEELAFTYFYPSIIADPDKVPHWPWSEEPRDIFAWTFLGSAASTALANGRNAEQASLHETEFIAPFARQQESNLEPVPTYLVGHIFAKETCNLAWQKALSRLQLGGERGYGWGRVCLEDSPIQVSCCFGYPLKCTEERPQITVEEGKALLAHTRATSVQCKGSLEPFVGRETRSNTGFGKTLTAAQICWTPGSCVSETITVQIGARGIWGVCT